MLEQSIRKEYIYTNVDVSTKEECLKQMAIYATELGISSDAESTFEGLMEREKECSTGFTEGIAIPHARCGSVQKAVVMILKTSKGIEWKSMDGEPVNIVIGLLVPSQSNAASVHMELLSSISRSLIDEDFRKSLKDAENPEEIYESLKKVI